MVGHSFEQRGYGFDVLPGCVQVGGAVLVGFAQRFGRGVAVTLRVGEKIREVCGVSGLHGEGAQVVRYHIGSSSQLHARSSGQIQNATQRTCGLIGVPPGEAHVFEGLGCITGRENRGGAVFSGAGFQLLEVLASCATDCRYLRHGAGEILAQFYDVPGQILDTVHRSRDRFGCEVCQCSLKHGEAVVCLFGRAFDFLQRVVQLVRCVLCVRELGLVLVQLTGQVLDLPGELPCFVAGFSLFCCNVNIALL